MNCNWIFEFYVNLYNYIKSACIIAGKKFWTKNSQPFVCVRSRCFTYDIVHEQEIDMEFVLNCVLTINRIKFALTLIFNRTPLCGSKELVKWLKLPELWLFFTPGHWIYSPFTMASSATPLLIYKKIDFRAKKIINYISETSVLFDRPAW